MQFCQKAMGPCVRLLARSSYSLIAKAKSWNCMINLSDAAIKELDFLANNFRTLNGHPLRPSLSQLRVEVKVSSDASDIGFCVYELNDSKDILQKKVFSEVDARKSSTFRELKAFHSFYTSDDAQRFKNKNIVHYTDNMNCETILTIGSRNENLQQMVLDIFIAWKDLNIKVDVKYLSRNDPIIEFADAESRNFDLHDFSIDFESFSLISNMFGEFEVDCFASHVNKKCIRYYSKFFEPLAEGVNFFAQRLPFCNLLVFPPTHLVIPTLYHLQVFNSYGCLIIPKWTSNVFWTFICNDGRHFNNFVKSVFIFSPNYISGEHIKSTMFCGVKKFHTLALKFDFNVSNAFSSKIHAKFCVLGGCDLCKEF